MYHAVVPTLADSTVNNGVYFSTFFVRAHTDDPTEHYETAAASGYSVDNLSPEPVDDITVQYKVAGITVEWSPSDAPDVGLYKVFKSDISDFEPDESTFIGTSVETTFTEEGAVEGEAFYKIAAIDFSGNSGLSDPYRFVLLPSPSNITIVDTPDDQGHFIGISWTAPEDNSGLIEEYRIYRSRSEILTDAVPMIQFASIDALNEYEANNTVLVTTVDANVTAIDDFVPIGGESYYYWIQAVGSLGASKIATADVITRIVEMPGEFSLSAAYPNPFNPSTTLEYSIPAESHISLVVYDALGRKVAILVDGIMKPGSYTAVWDGRDESGSMLGSGLYIYRFTAGSFTAQGKVMFLR